MTDGLRRYSYDLEEVRNARPEPFHGRPLVRHGLQRMAEKAGIAQPAVVIMTSNVPGLFAVPDKESPRIMVTRGALELLNDRELVAMLGHEISHITRQPDVQNTELGIFAAGTAGAGLGAALLGSQAIKTGLRHAERVSPTRWHSDEQQQAQLSRRKFLIGAGGGTAVVLGSTVAGVVGGAQATKAARLPMLRHFEWTADADGMALSDDPEAFASALRKLKDWAEKTHSPIESPTHPLTVERIRAAESYSR